ncbi:MAG: hypothetical protein ACRDFC_02580, partial [Ignavibacteria bacterium]
MTLLGWYRRLKKLVFFSRKAMSEFGFSFFLTAAINELQKYKWDVFKPEPKIVKIPEQSSEEQYQIWLSINNINSEKENEFKDQLKNMGYRPKLILVISVNRENKQYLMESLHSIK